jgi:hypothetical protein
VDVGAELIFIMGWTGVFWHFGNLLAPALGVGLLLALVVKMVWRQALRSVSLLRLVKWAVLVAGLGLVLGLLLTGRDGRMLGHALTLGGAALGLWWAGFVRPSRG